MVLLEQARDLAVRLLAALEPYAQNIQIAGSIRRRKPWVRDIEIVLEPRMYEQAALFGEQVHLLDALADFPWRQWGRLVKNGPRYKQLLLRHPAVKVDLFIVRPPAQFGYLFALRTGPAAFSRALVTPRRYGGLMPDDLQARGGAYWRRGEVVPTPLESDVFDLLGLEWVPPWERHRLVPAAVAARTQGGHG